MNFIVFVISLLLAISVSALPATETEGHTINPRAETLKCYNSGQWTNRANAVGLIDTFCKAKRGQLVSSGNTISETYRPASDTDVVISVQAVSGCSFAINDDCGRLLREPIDQCNTGGENFKQGGTLNDGCAIWRIDPEF